MRIRAFYDATDVAEGGDEGAAVPSCQQKSFDGRARHPEGSIYSGQTPEERLQADINQAARPHELLNDAFFAPRHDQLAW